MKRLILAMVVAVSGLAFAQHGEGEVNDAAVVHNPEALKGEHKSEETHGATEGGHHEKLSVPDYIFHHVTDDFAYEFEVPMNDGENPHIVFPRWRVAMPWGARACEPVTAHTRGDVGEFMNGCLDMTISKQTMFMFIAAFILIIAVLGLSNRDKNQLVPKGSAANIMEALVLFVRDELAVKNIGKEEANRYTPYLLSVFFFILTMNLLGLFPWTATATANIAVTCALALCTFFLTQYASIRSAGLWGYLKHLTGGVHPLLWPIMIPVEVLGLFTKPFALTVRLFANMVAGHIVIFFLLSLVFLLGSLVLVPVGMAFAMAIYMLELFVAFLQAFVFALLSALFIGMGVAMGHHGHDDHGHDDHKGDTGHAAAH